MEGIWGTWVGSADFCSVNATNVFARLDSALWCCNCSLRISIMALGTKTSRCGKKVCTTSEGNMYVANYPFREMQLFLIGYIIIEICEVFTVGEFPLNSNVRIVRWTPLEFL